MLPVLADTITPLMTADFTYLFLLNAGIGWVEGTLLKRWFAGGQRAVRWMIAANYLSAWIGWFGLIWLIDPRMSAFLGPRPIERINRFAGAMVLISFAITLLVEFGFVYLASERMKRSLLRAALATVCVNAISYIVICFLFLSLCYSLPFNAHVTSLSDLGPLPSGTLYWADPKGQLMARPWDRSSCDRKMGQVMQNDFVRPWQLRIERTEDPKRVQLSAEYGTIQYAGRPTPAGLVPPDPLLLGNAGAACGFPADYWDQSRLLLKSTLDVRPAKRRQLRVKFDRYRKFLATDVPGGPHSMLCVGLATFDWDLEQPTVLPDDKIIFEWAGQIVVFDPHTKKLAFIASGTCPAFIPNGE